jgi:hypothetical protein
MMRPRMNLATILLTALCACSPSGARDARPADPAPASGAPRPPADFAAELEALELRCARRRRVRWPAGRRDEALPVVKELEALASVQANRRKKIAAWGALARRAGTLDTLGASGARELCQKALAALLEQHERPSWAPSSSALRSGQNALAIGLPASQEFLRQLRAATKLPRARPRLPTPAERPWRAFEMRRRALESRALDRDAAESLGARASTQAQSRLGPARGRARLSFSWVQLAHPRREARSSLVPELTGLDGPGSRTFESHRPWRGQVIGLGLLARRDSRALPARSSERDATLGARGPMPGGRTLFVGRERRRVNPAWRRAATVRQTHAARAARNVPTVRPPRAALAALPEADQVLFRALRSSDAGALWHRRARAD